MRLQAIYDALLAWYQKAGRHELPWRQTNDIYKVYVSEVMLQQTQINRVANEYYPKFLERFPTLKSLSQALQDEVLSLWSGLGYYSRARNLHKSAKLTKGRLPHDQKELQKLPGIGRYTASAICSFALKQQVPVVDTNIKRVLIRFFALENQNEALIWERANWLLNTNSPREHNLALMDLGSLLCTPKDPRCDECPLCKWCQGKKKAVELTKKAKKKSIAMELFFGLCVQNGKVALVPSSGGMYKGMLLFPNVDPIEELFIGSYKHTYTKYRLTVKLYRLENAPKGATWISLENFESAHVPSLVKKAVKFF